MSITVFEPVAPADPFPWSEAVLREAAPDAIALRLGERIVDAHPAAKDVTLRHLASMIGARASGGRYAGNSMAAAGFGMGTSDFAQLLAAGTGPVVRRKYRQAARHVGFCAVVRVKDYRAVSVPRVDTEVELQLVGENGELAGGRIAAEGGAASVKVRRYGYALAISRQAIINDDMDTIGGVVASVGPTVARKEAALVAAALEAPAALDDGLPVFGVDNSVADPLDATSLAAAAAQLLNQPLPSGGLADHELRHLVVAPGLYVPACALVESCGLASRVTVTPMVGLGAGRWFALADAEIAPTIAIVRIEGVSEPVTVEPHRRPKDADGAALAVFAELGAVVLGRIGIVRGGA